MLSGVPSPLPAVPPVLIAVDGFSGAGKTTLAIELAAALRAHHRVALFHLEDIYPGWDGLADGIAYYVEQVAGPLAAGHRASWQAWDWEAGRYGETRSTAPAEIIIVEGVGASAAAADHLLDAKVWVHAPAELRREQALERDGEAYAPHWERWAAQERAWAAGDAAATRADITVDRQHRSGAPGDAAGYVLRALGELQLPRLQASSVGTAAAILSADRLDLRADPAELFTTLYGDSPRAVWLDSSSAAEAAGSGAAAGPGTSGAAHIFARSRFSIMADDGGALGRYAEHRSGLTTVVSGPVTLSRIGPFFQWLDMVWGSNSVTVPDDYPCGFALGWIGFLGYELKRETGGSDIPTPPEATPDAALLFAGRAVVLDHELRCVYALTLEDDGGAWAARVENALGAAAAAAAAAAARPAAVDAPPQEVPATMPAPQFTVRDSRESYLEKVRTAQREIAEGNSYEVCLTTSLSARLPKALENAEQLATYAALRRRSPAPFASLLRFGGFCLAGTSPERFLSIDAAGLMRAEPIKGTRPRGETAAEDRMLEADLVSSLKDRAENVMIVDLLRNDLSHHAVPGSVTVPRLCAVESYTTVHQLVSTVDAQLLPGASRAEAVAAAFPPGSMTGAPKISTMAILDRLEQAPRGPYSGVAGWFSLTGATDLSVVIRTLAIRGPSLTLGVGGAVTADSDPAEEWDEVRAKAFGVLSALGSRFPG